MRFPKTHTEILFKSLCECVCVNVFVCVSGGVVEKWPQGFMYVDQVESLLFFFLNDVICHRKERLGRG